MVIYTAITFSPVQGFIEKSRKLRDLYGASLILSYLSKKIVDEAINQNCEIISPGLPNLAKGMPNRILIKGDFPQDLVKQTLFHSWKKILWECKQWIETHVSDVYTWDRDWEMWATHTWEFFWGQGDSISSAIEDLENRKLSRDWVGINWIGESSSLTGTDAIAFNFLGAGHRNPKTLNYEREKEVIDNFYTKLSAVLERSTEEATEGKVLDLNERLSIPELVKRLITLPNTGIPQKFPKNDIPFVEKFTELTRKPEPENNITGQWTGWFMGDGDKVGDHLKSLLAQPNEEQKIKDFSNAMRQWGEDFSNNFPSDLGRIIYAGGDDFLGVIYNKNHRKNPQDLRQDALQWLLTLKKQWEKHEQKINLSVGFVWVAGSVPQRDVLQHCREAEKVSKNKGRDRVTIRIVFNSGQYVQWTTPWDNLGILFDYQDRDKKQNWTHIYNDLAQLKARHGIRLTEGKQVTNDYLLAKSLIDIYFDNQGEEIFKKRKHIVGDNDSLAFKIWVNNLVEVGWQLCS
ncbi:Cas10/Cmr2 second palm domain-containing protein [Cyanobacterium sp. DS4]|uniref:Cas10/Cmr2 second palm domain-containing protein n=1 Tax=Cyanobacterium sp. DS4 TaxID=2878255 RepID=UPI002E8233D1|nr:type III-B CRISPR-associated protein Cas10/Cmr2 [Cyanobacterium sp. Dongsha4]WVL00442.1 CRISPR-associated protein Cmr2 [Cyanobacterium sp. Dongsha4]